MNVENCRNEKDNSDDNYVKKKDNPEKKIKFENYSSIFRHEFELLQISKRAQLVQKVIKPSTFLCLQLYKTFVLVNDINAEMFVKEKKDKYAM